MSRRVLSLLVLLALAFVPAGSALALGSGAAAPQACCCGPMADACAKARVANVPHGCPCASRDETPAVPPGPPLPAGERPAAPFSSAPQDAQLAPVDLACVTPLGAACVAGSAPGAEKARGAGASLLVLDCVFRL